MIMERSSEGSTALQERAINEAFNQDGHQQLQHLNPCKNNFQDINDNQTTSMLSFQRAISGFYINLFNNF